MDGFMMRHGKSEECAAEYRREWGQDDSDEGEGESIGNGAESVRNEHSGAPASDEGFVSEAEETGWKKKKNQKEDKNGALLMMDGTTKSKKSYALFKRRLTRMAHGQI